MRLSYLLILAAILGMRVSALTVSAESVQNDLKSADLVADLLVKDKTYFTDPLYGIRWEGRAELLSVVRSTRSPLRVGDEIVLAGFGGELRGVGVRFSGFPQAFKTQRYRAHLKLNEDGKYTIAGYDFGFLPLDGQRTYSRNRTDGSDGSGSGPFLSWQGNSFPLPYFISLPTFQQEPEFIQAIDASFQTWSTILGVNVEFLALGCSMGIENQNDGVNQIIMEKDVWPFGNTVIAITRNFFVSGDSPQAGVILDSDVLINGVNHSFSTTGDVASHDMQNIMTHEIGHMLGLGHEINPSQDADATMFATAALGETKKRDLATNDFAGIRAGYGGANQKLGMVGLSCNANGLPAGCASQKLCSDKPSPVGWLSALAFVLFIILIPRRLLYPR